MALSIFNSERRVQLTILSAIVVTVPLALLNFATHVNLSRGKGGTDAERNFWQYKLRPSEKYDIVCLGDSRTLMGINPEFLEIELHCKAYNASFAAGSLNEVIFQHIDNNFLSRIPGRPKASQPVPFLHTASPTRNQNRSRCITRHWMPHSRLPP